MDQDDWIESCDDLLSLSDLPDFPEEWKTRLLKVARPVVNKVKQISSYRAYGASQMAQYNRYYAGAQANAYAKESAGMYSDEGYNLFDVDEDEDTGVFLIGTDDPDDVVRDVCAAVLDDKVHQIDEVLTQLMTYAVMAAHTKRSIERGMYRGMSESVADILEEVGSNVVDYTDEFSGSFLSLCGARLLKGSSEVRDAIEEELVSGAAVGDLIDGGYFSQEILNELSGLKVFAANNGYGIGSAPSEFSLDDDNLLCVDVRVDTLKEAVDA